MTENVPQDWFTRILNTLLCRGDLAHEKLETKPVSIKELFRYSTKKDKIMVAVGIFLAVVVGILQASSWIMTGYIANLYLVNKEKIGNDHLYWSVIHWCFAIAGCAIILIVTSYLQSFFLLSACTRIVQRIRSEYVKAVLRQDATWFETNDARRLSAQLTNNIERIQDGIADKFGLIVRGFSLFLFSALFSFYINWRVTLLAFLSGPLTAMTMGLMVKCSSKPMKEIMKFSNEASSIAEEAIMNVKTVAACNGQETMIEKYSSKLRSGINKTIQLHFLNGFFEGMMFFQIYFTYVAALFYGIDVYFESAPFEPGTIFMAINTTQLGGYFLSLLAPHLMSLLKARVSAAVIYEIIDRTPKIDPICQKGKEMEKCRGDITFENVHFKYPSRETKILNGCSWKAKAGETVAFVGHSGCGKSTSIGLLTRLYDKCDGKITIDGTPIENIRLSDLRKSIGIVQQEPCLFNGTIVENIVLGRDISVSMVIEASKIANAHEFVMKLKDGYDTMLGVGGVALSGGQKQRIAIARAIATNPKILLLDEATSALDTESERVVQFALNKASRGRTTIVIAHRLSTLKDVHRIHVIDKGRVAEMGSHLELMAKKGLYWAQAKTQEVGITEERKPHESVETTKIRDKPDPTDFIRSSDRASVRLRTSVNRTFTYEEEKSVGLNEKGGKKSSNTESVLLRIYGSSEAKWLKLTVFMCCFLRGLELPIYAFLQILPFKTLEHDKDTYMPWLIYSVIAFLVIGIWVLVFLTAAVGFGGWAAEITANGLKTNLLRALLHRDAAYFDKPGRSNAACVSTMALRSPEVNACLDYRFMIFVQSMCGLVFGSILTYSNFWKMGIESTIVIVVFGCCVAFLSLQTTNALKLKSKVDKTSEFAIEIFEQTKTIQLMSVESYFSDRYRRQQDTAFHIQNRLNHLQSALFMLSVSAVPIFDFFGYLVCSWAVYDGEISAARGVTAAITATFSAWATVFATPAHNDVVKAATAAKSLFSLMGETKVDMNAQTCPKIEGALSVEKLSFAYPTRRDVQVARNLNLRAEKGQAIALVGASGCGKSTIIQLLERFYTPDSGNINIDKNSILDISLRHLRNNISLVGQEPILFKGSIFENIVLGCEAEITIEDVKRVAEVANAAKFIEAFPQGYETDVGEKGSALSGGQKQRIAIARALIRNPKILLLDEATSALDTENEKKVQKALNDASAGRTSISIAHRLSTIRNADRIYFIENGSVAEYGTHDELIEADGKYAKLVEAQALVTE